MNESEQKKKRKPSGCFLSALVGAVVGWMTVWGCGITAFGFLGGVAGGAAAGPVGIVLGALVGLAIYGIYRAYKE